jgi:dGTPase
VPLWRETRLATRARLGAISERVLHEQTIVALIDRLVTDLLEATSERIEWAGATSVDEVRATSERLVGFSPALAAELAQLKAFLFDHLYHHPRVIEMNQQAVAVIGDLFEAYRADAALLPARVRARFQADGEARAIADYIAGMTDRFALNERERAAGRS